MESVILNKMTRVHTVGVNKTNKERFSLRGARRALKLNIYHEENIYSTLLPLNYIEKTGRESLQQKLQ